ncbi:hypothetical protein LQZ18_11145 [Lachnospiraceae bacterium ZAX-1]
MDIKQQEQFNIEIAEIERIVREFKEKFADGTSDADNFMNISDIEMIWTNLQDMTNNIYSTMIRKLMSEVDESALISKKKMLS